jgi:hypothetical protein
MRFVLMRVKAIASRQAIAAALPARILMKAILVSTKSNRAWTARPTRVQVRDGGRCVGSSAIH